MLQKLKRITDNAKRGIAVVKSTHALAWMRPAELASFARGALQTSPGPHLAVMYHARTQPNREAIVEYDASGVRRMTWGEFDAAINRLANTLIARGVNSGDRIALMLPNSTEYIIAQQALSRMSATAVQIGYRLKAGEVAFILENAAPAATIAHRSFREVISQARTQTNQNNPLIIVGDDDSNDGWSRALAAAAPTPPKKMTRGDGGGVIIYTSGTTGKPKGAKRSFRQTGLDSVGDMIMQTGMQKEDRHLVVCPLYHSAAPAFVSIMMAIGGTTVLMNHFEPEAALKIIQDEKITSSMMVPTMLVRMCALPEEVRKKYSTKSLRWIMSGAAPLSTETARQVLEQWGPVLWNFYGSTETGLVTMAGPADHTSRPGTIGKPLAGNRIRLLDDEGKPVPVGQVGELYARNSTLIAGYHGNDQATNDASRDGFFSVGDLGRIDGDGYYYLESRKHDMVISGGVNIYPREIEDHLHNHPKILEAAVVGVPDAEWGESLKAFIVPRNGESISDVEVIDYCRQGLADYKRPRKVVFLPELPRNPTGKVVKRDLKSL